MLKPGALLVDSAWIMTDLYDPNNPKHVKLKGEIEVYYAERKNPFIVMSRNRNTTLAQVMHGTGTIYSTGQKMLKYRAVAVRSRYAQSSL